MKMIMADVFMWLFLILGILTVVVGYWLLSAALFPGLVGRARARYQDRPVRTVGVGFAVTVPLVVLGLVLANLPNGGAKFAGFVVLLSLVLTGLVGSAGLARHVGHELASPVDVEQPWRRVLRGGTILSITFVLPLIGWLFVLPVTLVSGVGAVVGSWRSKDGDAGAMGVEGDLEAVVA
jgi:hypothetical protein